MYKPLKYSIMVSLVLLISFASIASAQAATTPDITAAKQTAIDWVEKNKDRIKDARDAIWNYAELGFKEFQTSDYHVSELKKAGFTIERPAAGMPTAYVATWGSGKPVIAILGELDALPDVSNVTVGAPGHGCGHVILGLAAVYGGIALKEAMKKQGIKGTIKVFGSPAEEIIASRPLFVAKGYFKDVDAVIDYHPGSSNSASYGVGNCLVSVFYRFYGSTAHGAARIPCGANDAAVLFTQGLERMREHMWETDKVHWSIIKGGSEPNVVPDYTEVWVYYRSWDMNRLLNEHARQGDYCALAAALMTKTKVEITRYMACWNGMKSKTLCQVVYENLKLIGAPKFTAEEQEYVKTELSAPYPPLLETISPPSGWELGTPFRGSGGSTDVSDVAWNVPTSGLGTVTTPPGCPGHHMDNTECEGTSFALKGLIYAIKVEACTGIDFLTSPDTIKKAWDELKARLEQVKEQNNLVYRPILPAEIVYPEYPYAMYAVNPKLAEMPGRHKAPVPYLVPAPQPIEAYLHGPVPEEYRFEGIGARGEIPKEMPIIIPSLISGITLGIGIATVAVKKKKEP